MEGNYHAKLPVHPIGILADHLCFLIRSPPHLSDLSQVAIQVQFASQLFQQPEHDGCRLKYIPCRRSPEASSAGWRRYWGSACPHGTGRYPVHGCRDHKCRLFLDRRCVGCSLAHQLLAKMGDRLSHDRY